jgi:hypothetical protein
MTCRLLILFCVAYAAWSQSSPPAAPIYRITVVERTVPAINYQYRAGPTRINFRGTILLPAARGDAVVESKQDRAGMLVCQPQERPCYERTKNAFTSSARNSVTSATR